MVQESNQQETSENINISFFSSLLKNNSSKSELTDEQIEARRQDFWKCPKCSEINYIDKIVCWKCYASRPQNYELPGLEELRKDLAKDKISAPLWTGLASLFIAGAILVHSYIVYYLRGIHPNVYTKIIFAVFFAGFGVILILYYLIRKAAGK